MQSAENAEQYSSWMDWGLLWLRVAGAGMMLVHGIDKLQGFTATAISFEELRPLGMPGPMAAALAVFAELGCALLLVIGLKTRWAALPLVVTMAVAAFQVHWADGFLGMEKALVYGVVYGALALTGAGRCSLDHALAKRRRAESAACA
jgi:putative oxidoreductase